jgi:hypothetical protein
MVLLLLRLMLLLLLRAESLCGDKMDRTTGRVRVAE